MSIVPTDAITETENGKFHSNHLRIRRGVMPTRSAHGSMAVYTTYMGVSKNNGTPKSSILIGFSIINHPFWGTPIFGNTHIYHLYFANWVIICYLPPTC